MKNHLILLLLYTFTIDPSKSIDLEATSTEEYTNADTTTKADLLENPRNEDIETTGKVEEIKNNDDNPGVVIPLERILAGLEELENQKKSINNTKNPQDHKDILNNNRNNQSQSSQNRYSQPEVRINRFSKPKSDKDKFNQPEGSKEKSNQLASNNIKSNQTFHHLPKDGSNEFDKSHPKYKMFENFPIVSNPTTEQNLVKTNQEPSKNVVNSKHQKPHKENQGSKNSPTKENKISRVNKKQDKKRPWTKPKKNRNFSRNKPQRTRNFPRAKSKPENQISSVTVKPQFERKYSGGKFQEKESVYSKIKTHQEKEYSRIKAEQDKEFSKINTPQAQGKEFSRIDTQKEQEFSGIIPQQEKKLTVDTQQEKELTVDTQQEKELTVDTQRERELSKRRRRPGQVPARRNNSNQGSARRHVYNHQPRHYQTTKTNEEKVNEGITTENNSHDKKDGIQHPTARRGRLRIEPPASSGQHDILGPHSFSIHENLSEDQIISHLLSTSDKQNKDNSEHRGRGKIAEHGIKHNQDNTEIHEDEIDSYIEVTSQPQSIFHPYSQKPSTQADNIRKRKVSSGNPTKDARKFSNGERSSKINVENLEKSHEKDLEQNDRQSKEIRFEALNPAKQSQYRQSKDFRFERHPENQRHKKDLKVTHGDNAHDDLEYVEEHVFEIKNDAPKTYNQRHAKDYVFQSTPGVRRSKDLRFKEDVEPSSFPANPSPSNRAGRYTEKSGRQSKDLTFPDQPKAEVYTNKSYENSARQSKDIKFEENIYPTANPRQSKDLEFEDETVFNDNENVRESKRFRFPDQDYLDYDSENIEEFEEELFLENSDASDQLVRVPKEINGDNINGDQSLTFRNIEASQQIQENTNLEPQNPQNGKRHSRQEDKKTSIPFIRKSSPVTKDGDYNFSFSSHDGQSRKEERTRGSKAIKGSYSYTSPDGQLITMSYTADENGFRPVGSHIPAPAPLPKHVQRLLDHLAKVNKKEQQKN